MPTAKLELGVYKMTFETNDYLETTTGQPAFYPYVEVGCVALNLAAMRAERAADHIPVDLARAALPYPASAQPLFVHDLSWQLNSTV